jgi:hypothetical protein
MESLQTGFGLIIGFIEHLQNVTMNNYDSLTELHTLRDPVACLELQTPWELEIDVSLCLFQVFTMQYKKVKVKFSPLQALDALGVVRG